MASRRRVVLSLALVALATAAALSLLATRSQAGTTSSAREIAALKAQLADAQRDARFWQQLTSAFVPAKKLGLNGMADHVVLRTPGGPVLALHFDNMNLAKAKNLNWVAYALPGRFTRADQARLNRVYGPGFTHFHDLKKDVHGGKLGTPGVWFAHIGTRNFTSPFGRVRVGRVDPNFMPTRPPAR
ncbi:MAG: hypothetical protein ABR521_13655 [Gaiellaceae bacterium]